MPALTSLPSHARRIWIVGPCGSGKSTVARAIGDALALPVYHLDELYHLPGWHSREPRDFTLTVNRITLRESWIVDGNYALVRRAFLSRADFIIWIDLPLRTTLPRIICRSVQRAALRTPCCNGNFESFRQTFASRHSMIHWALTGGRRHARELADEVTSHPHVRLPSPRAVRLWLRSVNASNRTIK